MSESIPNSQLGEPYKIRFHQDVEKMIDALVEMRHESKPDLIRRLIRKAVAEEFLQDPLLKDTLLATMRSAMREVIKPTEERIAKISAKGATASATSMYVNLETLAQLAQGKVNVKEVYDRSRVKAVAYVRTPNEDISGDVNG